ncbi:MAG: CRISPR-associated endonuclease Cas2 [Fusobacteriaceae bacterium]|jgi:CRISPR-associated protein Cas2|nr:CRISPR-associated endonuclease Cas2 [Fusobacteriaceae bacterium]
MEDYFFNTDSPDKGIRYFVVICYDITDNKRRSKLVKFLEKYSFRVQKSVFEGFLDKSNYRKIKIQIQKYIDETEDNVRIYRIIGNGNVQSYGIGVDIEDEEVIIL